MKIVVTELNWPQGIEMLSAKGWEVVYDPELWKERKRLRRELASADAIIVRNQTKVDAELLGWDHRLKVIGRLGVGLDNIDLKTAAEKNIAVVIGKNANAASVAEYVLAAIFSSARLLKEAVGHVREGGWNRRRFTGMEVYGKTLGLIGLGEIGHRVAVRAKALGMRVLGIDPFVAPYDFPVAETGVELVPFQRVIEESDFISLHVPLTPKTRHLIRKDSLERMKKTAVIINSARGGIIHETDLDDALKNGTIAGAVLDVLEHEPPPKDHPLLKRENCIITPHIAGLTEESQIRTSVMVSNEVIHELEGRHSICRVNIGRQVE